MSEIIAFPLPSGPNYTIPDVGDENWGQNVTNFLVAIPAGVVPTAGTFALTGDLSFGSSFGLVAKYLISETNPPANAGYLRLGKTDAIEWRNNANTGNNILAIDSGDHLTYNGGAIVPTGAVNPGTQYQLAYYAMSSDVVSGLTLLTPNKALASDSNGLPVASATTDTELGYVSGATSSLQAQINALAASIGAAVSVPLGMAVMSPTPTPPNSSFALANGQAISRSTYATLFSLIGTTFGVGDGSTTFNIPNLTDKFPVGAGNLYSLASTGGAVSHTLSTAEIPASTVTDPGHTHTVTITDPGHTHPHGSLFMSIVNRNPATGSFSGITDDNYAAGNDRNITFNGPLQGSLDTSITRITAAANSDTTGITVAGGGGAHSILNPYLGMYWMMRII